MLKSVLFVFAIAQVAAAGPLLFSSKASFSPDKTLKDPGPGSVKLNSGVLELQLEQSLLTKAGAPFLVTNFQPTQLDFKVHFRHLPGGTPGSGRVELSFERFDTVSTKLGLSTPRKDSFGPYFKGKTLKIHFNEAGEKDVEGLSDAINGATSQMKDQDARRVLEVSLMKSTVLGLLQYVSPDFSCLGGLSGKSPAAAWKADGLQVAVRVKMDCVFAGWATSGAKKVAILSSSWAPQVVMTSPGLDKMVGFNSKGENKIYFSPASREALMTGKVDNTILDPLPNVSEVQAKATYTAHVYGD